MIDKNDQELIFEMPILDSMKDSIAIINAYGIIVKTNKAWDDFAFEQFGQTGSTGTGVNYLEVCRMAQGEEKEDALKAYHGILSVLEGKADIFELEYPCATPTEDLWFMMRVNPTYLKSFFIISHINITRRKFAEKTVSESESKFRNLFEALSDSVFILNMKGEIVDANQTALDRLGYTKQQLVVMDPAQLNTPENAALFNARIANIKQKKQLFFETEHITSNGTKIPVEINSRLVEYNGEPMILSISRDISQRKEFQSNLQENEKRLKSILESSSNLFYMHDVNHQITYISPKVEELLGYTMEEAKMHWAKLATNNPINQQGVKLTELAISTGKAQPPYELELMHKSGKKVFVEVREAPVIENGKTVALTGALVDITDRKLAHQALRNSEIRFQEMFNHMKTAVAVYQPVQEGKDFKLINVNKAAEKLTNCKKSELLGKSILERFPGLKKTPAYNALRKVYQTGKSIHIPPFYYQDQKQKGWQENYIYQLPSGEIVVIIDDVSDRIQAEGALKLSRNALKLRNDISNSFILNEGDQIYASILKIILREFKSEFGFYGYLDEDGSLVCPFLTYEIWDQPKLAHKTVVFKQEDWKGLWGESLKKKKSRYKNNNLVTPDGHVQLRNALAVPILYRNKLIGQIVIGNKKSGIYTDQDKKYLEQICSYLAPLHWSEIKESRSEMALILAKERAEESEKILKQRNKDLVDSNNKIIEVNNLLKKANQELDNFVYRVSHDLRAPITSSLGLASLTQVSTNLAEIQNYSKMQTASLRKLDQFIKDILNYSRNSRLKITPQAIDFEELVDEALLENHYQIDQDKLKVTKKIKNDRDFKSDQLRLKIILNNLISNAIKFQNKYNQKHIIKIVINASPKVVKIKIEDNGIGIEQKHLERVFEMFYRATDKSPGTGIGLYILKDALEKLNGQVKLKSEVGSGTIFQLKIPTL
ncbi:MAG: PAS domain S-box protein [Candidatus Cyclobacteriaceae bacterium M3_2C_046]